MNEPNRRQFVQSGFMALLLTAEKAPMKIIDTHQHLWDLGKFRLPWISKGSFLDRNFLVTDYQEAVRGLGVTQSVYLEVDVAAPQQQEEADYIAELCQKKKSLTRAAVISGRPESDGFAGYVRPFKDHPSIRGVRRVLHSEQTPQGHCLTKEFVKGIQLLGELNLHFEICPRPGDLPDAIKLVDACPSTRFVLDHCGNPDLVKHEQWKKDIAELAKRKNVVGKVSGIVFQATPGKWSADDLAPVVKHTLGVFGPNRVMFGSDWPVCLKAATISQWVKALQAIVADRPEDEQRKLFHDNALAFYRLKEE